MSILIKLNEYDDTNLLELTKGQYIYDHIKQIITCVDNNDNIYVDKRELYIEPEFINQFIINPQTKVSLYDTNQLADKNQYTGNVLIFYNYNTKNTPLYKKEIRLDSSEAYHPLLSNVHYIVIERIENNICKRNLKNAKNGIEWKFIDAASHQYKNAYEPIIPAPCAIFKKISENKAISIIIISIILIGLFTVISLKTYQFNAASLIAKGIKMLSKKNKEDQEMGLRL